jgi:hypothetical protein
MTVFNGLLVQEDVLTHVDEGITIFRNFGTHSPNDTASYLKRLESSTRQRRTGSSWNLVLENLFIFFIIIPPLNTVIWDLMLCNLIEMCRYLENMLPQSSE